MGALTDAIMSYASGHPSFRAREVIASEGLNAANTTRRLKELADRGDLVRTRGSDGAFVYSLPEYDDSMEEVEPL